jgi:hypothetical protein
MDDELLLVELSSKHNDITPAPSKLPLYTGICNISNVHLLSGRTDLVNQDDATTAEGSRTAKTLHPVESTVLDLPTTLGHIDYSTSLEEDITYPDCASKTP